MIKRIVALTFILFWIGTSAHAIILNGDQTAETVDVRSLKGIVPLNKGGTAADLSHTGGTGQVVKQASPGAPFTVGTINYSEIVGTPPATGGSSYTLPAASTTALGGIFSLAGASSHQFETFIDSAGVQHTAQPAFTDLSGIISFSQLGSFYTNGQLLIGNSTTGLLQGATLTAGSNISIANTPGHITISSTASGGGAIPDQGTLDSYAAHNSLANGTSYDPRDPAYGAICHVPESYVGNGTTKTFAYTTPFTGSSDTDNTNFYVYIQNTSPGGTATVLNTSQFTVTGVNSGTGNITLGSGVSAPSSSQTIYIVHDDSAGIHAAAVAAAFTGGYVIAPDKCNIRNLAWVEAASIIGAGFAQNYGFATSPGKPNWTLLEPSGTAPAYGIDISGISQAFFEGFQITGGFNDGAILIGTKTQGGQGTAPGIVLQYMTLTGGTVNFGSIPGGTSTYIFGVARFTNFQAAPYGVYGPLSDFKFAHNNFDSGVGGNTNYAAVYLGPQQNFGPNQGVSGGIMFDHDRIEFSNANGLICDGCTNVNMEGVQFDGNALCAVNLKNGWRQIGITGGLFHGNANGGYSAYPGSTAAGLDANICFNGTPGTGLHVSNANFQTNFNIGNTHPLGTAGATTPSYMLDFNESGSVSSSDITLQSGEAQFVAGNNGAYVTDFAAYRHGIPVGLQIDLTGQPVQGKIANGSMPSQARGLPSNKWTGLYVLGTQVANNNASVPLADGFGGVIAHTAGMSPTYFTINNFSSNNYDCDVVDQKLVPNVNANAQNNPAVVWLPSATDPGYGGGFYQAHEADTNTCRLGGLTWATIANRHKVYAQTGCTPTGSWTNDPSYTGYYGLTSHTQGDSLSCNITTHGGPIYVWPLMKANNGGSFTWTLDGTTTGSFATQGNNAFTFPLTGAKTLGGIRIPVSTAGSHTINFAISSTTSTSNTVTIEGLGTPPGTPYHGSSPVIFLGGQVLAGVNGPQSGAVAAFNTDQQTQTAQLFADGLGTIFADIQSKVGNNTTDYFNPTGNASLTASGQAHVAEAFNAVMQQDRVDGNIVNPIDYGASCNSVYMTSQMNPQYMVNTTSGSPTISINHYTFQPGTATQTGGGSIGRRICFGAGPYSSNQDSNDLGPCACIVSVNTSNNTANISRNLPYTEGTAGAVIGGYPTNPNDPTTCQDDTPYIQNAASASLLSGGHVFLPTNCMVHNLTLPANTSLEGAAAPTLYSNGNGDQGPGSLPVQQTILNCGLSGFPDDTQQCIQANPYTRYSNFLARCLTFPYTPFGISAAVIGYSTSGGGPGAQVTTSHISFDSCPIDIGQAYGYNHPVSFTVSSITPNPDGVTSTMNVSSIDSFNFNLSDGWLQSNEPDFLALNRTATSSALFGLTTGPTTIIAVPPTHGVGGIGMNIGAYTINKVLTLSTTSAFTSPSIGAGMELRDEFSQHQNFGGGYNGDFSDTQVVNSVCTGTFAGFCWHYGPAVASFGNGGARMIGGRIEEMSTAGIICDGCEMYIDGVDFDFNGGPNIITKGSSPNPPFVQQTGGWMIGGGNCASNSGDRVLYNLGGNNTTVSVDGVALYATNLGYGGCSGTSTALFKTATGAGISTMHVSVSGGAALSSSGVWANLPKLTDFTQGTPAFYKQNVAGWPLVDNTQSALSITASGQVGIGTTVATAGMAIDALSNSTTYNSSIGLPSGTTANRPTTPVNGMLRYNSTLANVEAYAGSQWTQLGSNTPYNMIGGLTLSNDSTTPNTIFDMAPGSATSDSGSTLMTAPLTLTKTTGSWASGSGNGCLDLGSVATSTFYNVFLIENPATLATDLVCSKSAVSPVLPSGYTLQRRLNCGIKTDGSSHILPFTQDGSTCWWGTPTLDVNTSISDTTSHLETLNVPTGVKVAPICNFASSATGNATLIYSPDTTPAAATATSPFGASPGFSFLSNTSTGNISAPCPYVTTNTSAQVAVENALSTTTTISVMTQGWRELNQPTSGNLALDGTATGGSSTQTATASLSTSNPSDVVVLWVASANLNTVQSVADVAGLTWTKRKSLSPGGGGGSNLEEWYAIAQSPLSSDTITVTMNTNGSYSNLLEVNGVSGANTISPFDPNVGLPASSTTAGSTSVSTTASTSHAKDMVLASLRMFGTGPFVVPSGFSSITTIGTSAYFNTSYKVVDVPQVSQTYTYGYAINNTGIIMFVDAIKAAGP